jgi:hypothetical protein
LLRLNQAHFVFRRMHTLDGARNFTSLVFLLPGTDEGARLNCSLEVSTLIAERTATARSRTFGTRFVR